MPTHHQPCLTLIKKYKKLQYEIEPHSIFVLVIGRALLKFLKVETPESVKLLLIAVWNEASDFNINLATAAANSLGS